MGDSKQPLALERGGRRDLWETVTSHWLYREELLSSVCHVAVTPTANV